LLVPTGLVGMQQIAVADPALMVDLLGLNDFQPGAIRRQLMQIDHQAGAVCALGVGCCQGAPTDGTGLGMVMVLVIRSANSACAHAPVRRSAAQNGVTAAFHSTQRSLARPASRASLPPPVRPHPL
jgi:hypothetical protein